MHWVDCWNEVYLREVWWVPPCCLGPCTMFPTLAPEPPCYLALEGGLKVQMCSLELECFFFDEGLLTRQKDLSPTALTPTLRKASDQPSNL